MWREIGLSLFSGLLASALTGGLLIFREQARWRKTKNFFVSRLSGEIYLAGYEIIRILNIDVTREDDDYQRPDEEIVAEILGMDVSASQFAELDYHFRLCVEKLERFRAQALAIPTFTPEEFHQSDSDLKVIRSYTSAYYFFSTIINNDEYDEDEETPNLKNSLKEKLVEVYRFPRLRLKGRKLTWKQEQNRKKLLSALRSNKTRA